MSSAVLLTQTDSTSAWHRPAMHPITQTKSATSMPVKRMVTVQEITTDEQPHQGLLVIQDDDDDDDDYESGSEDSDASSIMSHRVSNICEDEATTARLTAVTADPHPSSKSKPLPQIPVEQPVSSLDDNSAIEPEEDSYWSAPTRMSFIGEGTPLEPIVEDQPTEEEEEVEDEQEDDDDYVHEDVKQTEVASTNIDVPSSREAMDVPSSAAAEKLMNVFHEPPIVENEQPTVEQKTRVDAEECFTTIEKHPTTAEQPAVEDRTNVPAPAGSLRQQHFRALDGWRLSLHNEDASSLSSFSSSANSSQASLHQTVNKPFEPPAPSPVSAASAAGLPASAATVAISSPAVQSDVLQPPHTPDEGAPSTVWSVDMHLRKKVSKEELPPLTISTQALPSPQAPSSAVTLTASPSLCSRCSSISRTPVEVISPPMRHASTRLNRPQSTLSLLTSPAPEPEPSPSLVRDVRNLVALHKSQSSPQLVPASPLQAPQDNSSVAPSETPFLLNKSRLSIASFSLTHDKDAIKTYRRMASKTHNKDIQMTYCKYLLEVAQLYKDSHDATRGRLLGEAAYWIERLAKAGLPEALYIKGKWHMDGDEAFQYTKQPNKAFKCFQSAARLGWIEAYYELARYFKSQGEFSRAISCYKSAANKGHIPAIYKLAKIYLRGQLNQKRNIKTGFEYLKQAADAAGPESAEPAHVLSCVYADELERIGIAKDSQMSRKNIPLAIHYLEKAAQFGLPMAVHRLGQVHEHGLLGQPTDPWQGYLCYTRAAEDGYDQAMLDLSRLYAQGIPGLLMPQHEMAFKWCQRATHQGLEQAEYVLGSYYEAGIGTLPDYPRALEYFGKAASKGYEPAAEKLNLPSSQRILQRRASTTSSFSSIELVGDAASPSGRPPSCFVM